jgi:hypothetical protein
MLSFAFFWAHIKLSLQAREAQIALDKSSSLVRKAWARTELENLNAELEHGNMCVL